MTFRPRSRPFKSKKCWCGSRKDLKNCHGAIKGDTGKTTGKAVEKEPTFSLPNTQPIDPMGVPGEEQKLWIVPRTKDQPVDPRPQDFVGQRGNFRVQMLLSRPGYPITDEREHKFIDGVVGDSHVAITKPLKERKVEDVDQILLDAHTPEGKAVIFTGVPNDNGYLGKLVVDELPANSFQDAETVAYEAIAPFLSSWSLHLDIPVHVETIQVTELKTQVHSLRVRNPMFEMTFAGGVSPVLSSDFCQYASLYREGMNSNSGFYRFLCFYKIVESIPHRRSRLGGVARQAGQEVRRFREEIPSDKAELLTLLRDIYPWRKTWDEMALSMIVPVEVAGKKIGWIRQKYLNPLRVGIAHALLKTGEVRITLDKIDHIQQVNQWLPLCRVLARMLLKNEFPKEFEMAMKPVFGNSQG